MPGESSLILIVEDEPGTAMLQRKRLERAGFRVDVASDVADAMHKLGGGAIDLVLMDYRLGSTTGLDLSRRMKASGYDVPVIIVSGSLDDATVVQAMRAGIKDVVVKNLGYLDSLPDTVRGVLRQASAVPERHAGGTGRTRILIVEDDPGVAALQRRQLQRAGYSVSVAATLEQAMAAVRGGSIDLILIDFRLGDGSGLDLYEQVRAESWRVPAILVTGFPDQAIAIRALRTGIRDFIPKSAGYLEYLPAAVDRVMAQVRIERKLIESELRLASIIGTAMDAIVMCDERLRIVLFNRSAEEMFRCPAADALTHTLGAFIPGIEIPGDAATPAQADLGTLQRRVEVEGRTADGERVPIEVSISDVTVDGRRLFTVIARDISERRRVEAELREADRRKDVFLGMLAHELRNPLAAISTAGEVLHRSVEQPGARKLTGVVRRQTQALARMVDDLLDVSRVTLGKIQLAREPILLAEIVSRAVEAVRDTASRAELRLEVAPTLEPVWLLGDATRLEQVLTNLLANAVKFTPAGGRVSIDARREGAEAVIRVRDSGAGIDPELLPRVFDLFVQGDTSLDRSKSGLGIGLALVHQVVSMHGGQVTAYSEGTGHGSEFVVRLPASIGDLAADMQAPASTRDTAGRIRVLVVDDQPDLADCVAMLIETMGHAARAVYGGAEALDAATADPPDLILVDIGMPGVTGYDFAREARSDPRLRDVKLVALTGYGREEDRTRILRAGFDVHLTKPVTDARLRDLLDSVAASSKAGHSPQ
ncbi:MAG: response regulator [Vicinamibacterales bacterium]